MSKSMPLRPTATDALAVFHAIIDEDRERTVLTNGAYITLARRGFDLEVSYSVTAMIAHGTINASDISMVLETLPAGDLSTGEKIVIISTGSSTAKLQAAVRDRSNVYYQDC